MSDFWAMGGYAVYVWPAYIVVGLVMVGLLLMSWRGLKSKEAALATLRCDSPAKNGAANDPDDQGQRS
jgi:heme exporter protein D